MELEKLEEYRDATGIALLNAYNNGLLSREEYQLVQRYKRSRVDDPAEFLRSVFPETIHEGTENVESTKSVESTKDVPSEATKYVESTKNAESTKNEASLSVLPSEFDQKEGTENVESTKIVLSMENSRSSLETGSYEDTEGSLLVLSNVSIKGNYTKLDNDVSDLLNRLQTPVEQSIYNRLYRLSVGWGRNYCRVGSKALLSACNIKDKRTLNAGLDGLIEKGHIKPINRNNKGVMYRIFFPQEILNDDSKTSIEIVPVTDSEGGKRSQMEGTKNVDSTYNVGSPKNVDSTEIPPNKDINKNNIKDTLSPRAIISGFYKGIGQQKITAEKRERAEHNFKELLDDGFDPGDIQFTVEWTLKNAKEELYDFSIIKHTIGQAMAAKKKVEAGEARRKEKEKAAARKEAEEKKVAEEEARIKAHKESLDAKERAELRERAEAEIRSSGQYKKEFITEFLIGAKENELIKNQIGIESSK